MTTKVMVRRPITNPAVIDYVRERVKKNPTGDNLYQFALMLYDTGDDYSHVEMYNVLKRASDMVHLESISHLGDCYFFGLGVERDRKKGIELYLKATERGFLSACFSAGNELMFGKNIEPDYPKAYTYLKKAADDDDDRAINSLGIMYLYCYQVKQNRKKTMKLFKKAAKLGNEQAVLNIAKLESLDKDADFSEILILKPSERPKEGEE